MANDKEKKVADSAPGGQAEAPARPLLLLVDGHSLAFRSFYAFAKGGDGGLSTKAGIPTSVTYGFLKALLDNCRGLTPQGVVIAFDTAEPTFRHEADAAYKAHRDEAPEHFFSDLATLQEILAGAMDLPLCMAPGYEADDVLGTLANRAAAEGWRVRILSGDRDLFQLVDDERDVRLLGAALLRRLGCDVVVLEDGADVARALEEAARPFDALVLAIPMRRSDGADICADLRAGRHLRCAAVALTGATAPADVARYFARGFDVVLAKPFGLRTLAAALVEARAAAAGRLGDGNARIARMKAGAGAAESDDSGDDGGDGAAAEA